MVKYFVQETKILPDTTDKCLQKKVKWGKTFYKVQEKKSLLDTCETLHIIKKEHDKVYYYGRIIKLVQDV